MTPIQRNPKVVARLGQLEAQKIRDTMNAVMGHIELLRAWGLKDEAETLEAACDRIGHAIWLLEDEAIHVLGKEPDPTCSWCLQAHKEGPCDEAIRSE